jgi:surface antigen
MYVESILGNGKVRVSQYNAGWDGRYSVSDVPIAGLQFIHF